MIKQMINKVKSFLLMKKANKALITFEYVLLFLYVFSLPSFSARHPYNYLVYGIMFLLILNTLLLLFGKGHFIFKNHILLIPLFVFVALPGTILFSNQFRGWITLLLLAISFMVFFFAFSVVDRPIVIVKIIVWAIFAFSAYFLLIYYKDILNFRSFGGESFRLGSYFDNVNSVGSYFAFSFSLSVYITLFAKKKIELLYLFHSLIFVVLGITTGSRTFIISIFISIIVLLIVRFKSNKIFLFVAIASLLGLSFLIINLPFMSSIKLRLDILFQSLLTGELAGGSVGERYLWQLYGSYLGVKQFIFGYGYGGFAIYSGVGTYTHANYAEILCNFGVFGILTFYGSIIYLLYKSIINRNDISKIVIVFCILWILTSPSNVFYYDKEIYLMFAFMFYAIGLDAQEVKVKTKQKYAFVETNI